MRHFALLFASLLGLIISLAPACIADHTSNLPTWKPDPAQIKNLGPETAILNYKIRAPAGYTMVHATQGTFQAWAWKGKPHPDGSAAGFSVIIGTMPPEAGPTPDPGDKSSLAQFLQMNMLTLQRTRQGWFNTNSQFGEVDGHVFARSYWKGVYTNGNGVALNNHGFDYVAINGRNIITVRAEDVEPYNTQDLAIAEAAAMTFQIEGN